MRNIQGQADDFCVVDQRFFVLLVIFNLADIVVCVGFTALLLDGYKRRCEGPHGAGLIPAIADIHGFEELFRVSVADVQVFPLDDFRDRD